MSIEKKTFAVALLGVADAERTILQRTFGFTTSLERTRAYEIVNGHTRPDILIVNAEDPIAMQQLRTNFVDAQGNASVPTVYSAATRPTNAKYHIRRPWFAARILKTLDEVTVGEMDFIPEFSIGDNTPTQISSAVSRAQEAAIAAPATATSGLTALVVDDSLPVRKQVEMELKLNGIGCELVASGEEALEAIKRKKYDAVFLDVMMPGINGYQTCKAIKADALNRHTPVIMLTGKSSSFDKVKGKFAGCDSYITKPVGRADFKKIIEQYLSNGFHQEG